MAYFDSPKNRAFWEKELRSLEKQREEMQGQRAEQRMAATLPEVPGQRVRINLETLLQQEFGTAALGRTNSQHQPAPALQKGRSL